MPSFIDLREFILNGCQPELPTVADVGIGTGMLYAGRINEIHGEPGTGKSNVAIALSNAVMKVRAAPCSTSTRRTCLRVSRGAPCNLVPNPTT